MGASDSVIVERRRTADLALAAVAAIWGLTFPIIQRAIVDQSTLVFLQARFLIAVVLLVPFAVCRSGLRGIVPLRSIPPGLFLATGYLLQTEGLRTISPSVSAFLTGTNVIFVPLLATLLRWERTTPRRWFATALAWVGIFLLHGMRWPDSWTSGETLTLLCAVAFAGQIVALGRLAPGRLDAVGMTSGQMVVAALLFLLVGAFRGERFDSVPLSPAAWTAALFTGVLATALAFWVQVWAQKRTAAGHVAVILACEGVFAAFFSTLFFDDHLTALIGLGALALFTATLVVTTEPIGSPRAGEVPTPDALCRPDRPGGAADDPRAR